MSSGTEGSNAAAQDLSNSVTVWATKSASTLIAFGAFSIRVQTTPIQ